MFTGDVAAARQQRSMACSLNIVATIIGGPFWIAVSVSIGIQFTATDRYTKALYEGFESDFIYDDY